MLCFNNIFYRICFLITLLLFFINKVYSQKAIIDSAAINNWEQLGFYSISNNGQHLVYSIKTNVGTKGFYLSNTESNIHKELDGIVRAEFSDDSKFVFTYDRYNNLSIINLKTNTSENLGRVNKCLYKKVANESFVLYARSTQKVNAVVIRNIQNKDSVLIKDASYFEILNNSLLVKIEGSVNDSILDINLISGSKKIIWPAINSFGKIFSLVVSSNKKECGFGVHINDKSQVYIYSVGKEDVKKIYEADDRIDSILVGALIRFDAYNKGVYVSIIKKENSRKDVNYAAVNKLKIWRYSDLDLYPLENEKKEKVFTGYISFIEGSVNVLAKENEYLRIPNNYENDSVLVIESFKAHPLEVNWNKFALKEYRLINTQTGKTRVIYLRKGNSQIGAVRVTPDGRHVIIHDIRSDSIYMKDLKTDVDINLGNGLNVSWLTSDDRTLRGVNKSTYEMTFLMDNSLLVYDQYDIWKFDLSLINKPINITNGFGRKHNIVFRPLKNISYNSLNEGGDVILLAYNVITKDNGFYKIKKSFKGNPLKLSMDKYLYYIPDLQHQGIGSYPLKAKYVNSYLVERTTAEESKNLYYTNDFITFNRVSNIHYENKYNWVRSELHQFEASNGESLQGVLYKPENFDSSKKYPVIIYFYEKMSDLLNAYHIPKFSDSRINIPWFVSREYLVFIPDIKYKFGSPGPGENALNCILGAANYLTHLSYINRFKIGIQGISFGGYETNYIVGRTNLFAAAVSGSGPTNLISFYLADQKNRTNIGFVELGQFRMAESLWSNKELYLNNTPILNCDSVSTPLLLFQTAKDEAVDRTEAIQFFLALRRLGKPCWLLEYQEGNHAVSGESSIDFTYRMTDFFDYLLKDKMPPAWMNVEEKSIIYKKENY